MLFFCASCNLSSSVLFRSRAVKTEKQKSNQYLLRQFAMIVLNRVLHVLSFPSVKYYFVPCIFSLKGYITQVMRAISATLFLCLFVIAGFS